MTNVASEHRKASAKRTQPTWLLLLECLALPTLFLLTLLFFSFWDTTGDVFRQSANFRQVASSQAYLGIITLASIVPLMCGKLDFSIAQTAGLTQVVCAAAMSTYGVHPVVSVLIAVPVGALIGFTNGVFVAKLELNSLIVTLGTSAMLLGIINWYTGGASIIRNIPMSFTDLGAKNWIGVPRAFWLLLVAALVVYYVLQHTPFGRYLASIGSNPSAARLVGLRVERLTIVAFTLAGSLAGVAGVLLVARNGGANPQLGNVGDTLQALAAVYLGATAIQPGRFNVLGSMIAIYFIAFSVTGFQLAGVDPWINDIFNGTALFVAVAISTTIGRKRARAM